MKIQSGLNIERTRETYPGRRTNGQLQDRRGRWFDQSASVGGLPALRGQGGWTFSGEGMFVPTNLTQLVHTYGAAPSNSGRCKAASLPA
jgi:hypothetical protein